MTPSRLKLCQLGESRGDAVRVHAGNHVMEIHRRPVYLLLRRALWQNDLPGAIDALVEGRKGVQALDVCFVTWVLHCSCHCHNGCLLCCSCMTGAAILEEHKGCSRDTQAAPTLCHA